MKFNKDMVALYAITDGTADSELLYTKVEQALKGGVTIVQLREKELSFDELVRRATDLKELCHKYNVPLVINDNAEVALKSGADGVHLGADDTPVSEIRKKAGADFIIGATAKTVEQAKAAEENGADYIGVGAVFPSPTKKNAIRISIEQLDEICSSVSIPAVAIGGITLDNISELKGGGMSGVAVVSALFGADDIESTTRKFREYISREVNL